jgi:hypothetical protein
MNCPASYATGCEHVMVGDSVQWTGDEATAARPITVAQAAAAFATSAEPSSVNVCMAVGFTGAPVLEFPADSPNAMVEGVVVVFPSAQALAAVHPTAASKGESDLPPNGHQDCSHFGPDLLRGSGSYAIRIDWIARANVLIGVQYDTSLGPTGDPFVALARSDLAKLP